MQPSFRIPNLFNASAGCIAALFVVALSNVLVAQGQTLDRVPKLNSASGQLIAKDSPSRWLAAADAARIDNEERFVAGAGTGQLRLTLDTNAGTDPTELTVASLKISYDSPKFALSLVNKLRLNAVRSANDSKSFALVESKIVKEEVIFDGKALYNVKWFRDGTCAGEIYFAFSRQAVLTLAGYPFEHPLHLWKEALNVSRVKTERTQVTPLVGGGFMATEQRQREEMRFVIFNRFGYDLRRVRTLQRASGLPIAEVTMDWDESDGVFFVRRFAKTEAETRSIPGSEVTEIIAKRTLEIEFDKFQCNGKVDPAEFSLANAGIPFGTRFVDKRSRTTLNDNFLIFDGTKLISQGEE